MRAVSLSHTRVIDLLNRYYVPVFLSNEEYEPRGAAPAGEKAELQRIHRQAEAAGLSVGSVYVFLLAPDGRPVASLHTAKAAQPELLINLLEGTVRKLGTAAGGPVVKPAAPTPPRTMPDALLLHLTARYLERRGDGYVLTNQSSEASGDWSALPSEDWIALSRARWSKLLPPPGAGAGHSWEIDRELATQLLTHFYPPTENWDLSTHRLNELSLRATVTAPEQVRIEGRLRMTHSFYHKKDDNFVEATVRGFVEFEPDTRQIRSFRLVTDEAVYRRGADSDLPFGVAVRTARLPAPAR